MFLCDYLVFVARGSHVQYLVFVARGSHVQYLVIVARGSHVECSLKCTRRVILLPGSLRCMTTWEVLAALVKY